MPLSDTKCRAPNQTGKPEKRFDGAGLYLLVTPTGRKSWHHAYRFDGQQRTQKLGTYPAIGLATARRLLQEAKEALANGVDPHAPENSATGPRFREVAEEWIARQTPEWSEGHRARTEARIRSNLYPRLGDMPIASITTRDVLDALQAIEARGAHDIVRRVKQSAVSIFDFAKVDGRVESNPARGLEKALVRKPRVRHHAKLAESELVDFFGKLRTYDGEHTRLAIEMVMHTAVRTNELRMARWGEFEGAVWRIPSERMKMGTEHLVPLTASTRRLLGRLREMSDSEWVFPGQRGKPISSNTMIAALYKMGYRGRLTIHGMRGTFSTVLNESGKFHPDWIEMQLAHDERDGVRAAYNSAQYWEHRVTMMDWWSRRLDTAAALAINPEDFI